MARGLQNVIHYVGDLEKAADLYRRAGFTVGPRDELGFSPERRIQVPGFSLTLMGELDRSKIPPEVRIIPGPEPKQALTGIMLEDFEASAAAAVSEPVWTITARLAPTAEELRSDPAKMQAAYEKGDPLGGALADIGFSISDPYEWQDVWNANLQDHANSVSAVAGVVIVANDPSDDHAFLSAYTGQRELRATSAGVFAQTRRGEVSIMTPVAFRDRFAISPPDVSAKARLAAVRFAVRDRRALVAALAAGSLPHLRHLDAIVVAPEILMGATLVFEPEGARGGR